MWISECGFWNICFIFLTGSTGLTGNFFGFPDESQKFQSSSTNKNNPE